MKTFKVNWEESFIEDLMRLEPQEFLGLARILKVKVLDDENEPRDFWEILKEVLENYENENRKRRREIRKIVRAAVRGDN